MVLFVQVAAVGLVQVSTVFGGLAVAFTAAAATTDPAVRVTGLLPATKYYYTIETISPATLLASGLSCFVLFDLAHLCLPCFMRVCIIMGM